MNSFVLVGTVLMSASALASANGVYGDCPDAKHAWAVHDWNRPKPPKVEPAAYVATGVPSDAVVLFDGTRESLEKNWCDRNGKPTLWKLGSEGDFYCVPNWKNGGNIQTRAEFADCQLHIEFRHEADVSDGGKGPQMRGNSGIFLGGMATGHEVQVLESYYTSRELEGKDGYVDNYADGQSGAVYAENPPLVNPQRKPGEWQTYDIVYHQSVFDGDRLVHPGSITVLFNGVLVQDHWILEGLTTHRKRRPLAPQPSKGPLALQDHGCTVHYRNIWYRPIPSPWANLTHSSLTADENAVMRLRRETAAKLFAAIRDHDEVSIANMQALAEVIAYAKEGQYAECWQKVALAMHEKLDAAQDDWLAENKKELLRLREQLDTLIKAGVVSQACGTRKRISAIALRLGWEK